MNIASFIDHTALKPDTTEDQIRTLCGEAKEHRFATVCINPTWVRLCADLLAQTGIGICTVVGFPLGANMSEIKAKEAGTAFCLGANEIDMVLNIGAFKSGDFKLVRNDIRAVRNAVPEATLKVIIETCLLTYGEKIVACRISQDVGADFVKTSTGFSASSATIRDVRLMRQTVGSLMGVKAAGGIRDLARARAMIEAGATRIGCSASVAIVKDEISERTYTADKL